MRALAPFLLCIAAFGQAPKSACDFDGFDTNAKLAEVKLATIGYYQSLTMKLQPGDTVVINRVEGDWTCGYLTARKGGAQGWVRSGDIRLVEFDPNPPSTAWVGTWVQDQNHITIRPSNGKLMLDGEAYWFGPLHNGGHIGEISGETTPVGNKMHYADGLCEVDFALFGRYILANDNNMCGGMNVRFWGVWKRAATLGR